MGIIRVMSIKARLIKNVYSGVFTACNRKVSCATVIMEAYIHDGKILIALTLGLWVNHVSIVNGFQ